MQKHYTQIRVQPLRSGDRTSKKFSLEKSLLHDTRMLNESHIDKTRSHKNISVGDPNLVFEKIESLKKQYGTITKRTTIDCANFMTTVNKNYFQTDEAKKEFLLQTKKFLETEFEDKNAVLYCVGHDDEDGFHVHAYCCPVVKSTLKNRHGIQEKTTINYRSKYSNSQEEINQARNENKTSELKLGKLQDRWSEHISKIFIDLVRGEKDTNKKNITPKEYRKMVQEELPELEKNIAQKQKQIASLDMQIYQKETDIENIDKSMQKMLRENVSISDVAAICGFKYYPDKMTINGKEFRIRNAIDYLMYNQGCNYKGAIKFLFDNFGQNATKNEQMKHARSMKQSANEPKYIEVKRKLIDTQFKALGNPIVRVTATKIVDGKKETIILGKYKKGEERFFNKTQLIERMSQLNMLNANGYNIFITPIEHAKPTKYIHIFVDDVKDIEAVKKELGEPNLILETSPKNYQFVYNVNNEIVYKNSQDKGDKKYRRRYLNFFNEVNNFFGDEKISGLRHPFRLVGFGNNKPNRDPYFTRIISSSTHENDEINQMILSDKYDMNPKAFRAKYLLVQKHQEENLDESVFQTLSF